MIKIEKNQKPQVLIDNEKEWTKEYLNALSGKVKLNDSIKNRYNHKDIKKALEKETYGKCAYCESKIKHITYGDIEHILPKNKDARPELYVNWENLTLSCETCNRTYKGDYYEPSDPLINPVEDDPEKHLVATGPFIYPFPKSRKGEVSVNILRLNRSGLWERRKERIEQVLVLVKQWEKEANQRYKNILYEQIKLEIGKDTEYSFVVNKTLEIMGYKFNK